MESKDRRTVLYRGSLKSCNYRCSYCPFSKHPGSERELLRDREQWIRFCSSLSGRADRLNIGAVMVVPYGEALIHPWYWEGLGRLAAMEAIDGAGAQTNLSFSLEQSLELYERAGGIIEKLKLWVTFHPEMTTVEEFAGKCRKLSKAGAAVSAGAVGSVENLESIKKLRRELPEEIYLWINKMDGLGRNYTREETAAFRMIDPYFERELGLVHADPRMCTDRLFVEGDGRLRRCNISRTLTENWYGTWEKVFDEPSSCGKRVCSCYLAYGGRNETMNRVLFGPYPLFRIPKRPKAVFLDIDGTLIPAGERQISKRTITEIQALAGCECRLFFATSLPYKEAKKKCREVWNFFDGGIFAGGAHVVLNSPEKGKECFFPMERTWISVMEQMKEKYCFRILTYGDENCGGIYKITLVHPKHMGWKEKEAEAFKKELEVLRETCKKEEAEVSRVCNSVRKHGIRCFAEGNCLQIVNAEASKGEGMKLICRWIGILPEEAAAQGDSPEDEEMMKLCSTSGAGTRHGW